MIEPDLRPGGPNADRGLPAAVLGNGSLVATVSGRGEVERLFWPHVDRGQHLGELRLGVFSQGRAVWLDDPSLEHGQSYLPSASVLETTVRGQGVEVVLHDLVLPDAPVLLRRVRGAGALRLLVHCRPDFEEARHGHAAYVDPGTGALVLYRRDRVLALGISPRARRHAAAPVATRTTRPGTISRTATSSVTPWRTAAPPARSPRAVTER